MEYPENRDIEGPNYAADEMREEALAFVEQNKDRPFFLYWTTPIPHVSLQVPEESLKEYEGQWPEKPFKGRYNPKTGMGYSAHPTPRAAYAAMVSHMDRNVGRLMEKLDELGIADNTLLIFTSDNGVSHAGGVDYMFFNSQAGLRGTKGQLYEGGIRVPFIARWPGRISPGTTCDHVSAFWDMLPTFGEIAGADVPDGLDGISLLPALTGKQQKPHEFLYWEFNAENYNGGQVAVRMGDWKGIKTRQLKGDPGRLQLYNLKMDRGEQYNVAAAHPAIVERIEAVITREHLPSRLFPFAPLDD